MQVSDDVIKALLQLNGKLVEEMNKYVEQEGYPFGRTIVIKLPVENKPSHFYSITLQCSEYVAIEFPPLDQNVA